MTSELTAAQACATTSEALKRSTSGWDDLGISALKLCNDLGHEIFHDIENQTKTSPNKPFKEVLSETYNSFKNRLNAMGQGIANMFKNFFTKIGEAYDAAKGSMSTFKKKVEEASTILL